MPLFCGREEPWSVAGNDGEMAEPEQVLTIDKMREETGSTTRKNTRELPKRRKPRRKSGVERLRQAADKRGGKNSEELADLLTAKALKGKLSNTRFLVGLAERKEPVEKPKKKRRGLSMAQQLAMEPEWVGPAEGEEE